MNAASRAFRFLAFKRGSIVHATRPRTRGQTSFHTDSASVSRPRRLPHPAVVIISLLPLAAYGVWYWYTYNTFPSGARRPLRRAMMKHYYTDDPKGAVGEYLSDECRKAGLQNDSNEITGIQLRLAEMYDTHLASPKDALALYTTVLHMLSGHITATDDDPQQMKKMVGIAHRLGDIHRDYFNDLSTAREWYEWAIRFMIGFREHPPTSPMPEIGGADPPAFVPDEPVAPYTSPATKPVKLPDWVSPTDIGSAMEALAGIYSRQNRPQLALAVYLRALEILDTDNSLSTADRHCRKAILQNNIAETHIAVSSSIPPSSVPTESPSILSQALEWTTKAAASAQLAGGLETCPECTVCAECNTGTIKHMMKDYKAAKRHFVTCRDLAAEIKFVDGVKAAREGMQRVNDSIAQLP
ncbi:hypothetical protein PhCBS80983_g04881 [Powellomyces hirtus]|uniref:Uncharacterized protein n=1 Tax=Powellomyces hirtus TaxID=109895 RepID=A0A507DXB4_9FUNG|nr:hypothetical protein PhCBS80983_g04881 [Powellomyces hirtus]